MRTSAAVLLALPLLDACRLPGCIGGGDACEVPSPCEGLTFAAAGGFTELRVITSTDEVPGGNAALGAPGDILLANDKVVAVIDALDHPHYLAPTGGNLLDLSNRGQDDDGLRQIVHATGLLPDDTVRYTDLQLIDEGDVKAVQVTGVTDGRPIRVHTRYEIRPGEPGIRVRTELVHEGVDPIPVLIADGVYYGDRNLLPFSVYPGAGFEHPSFGLSTVTDVLREVPYMVAGAHPADGATYGLVACDRDVIEGFHSTIISGIGAELKLFNPRDWRTYERFVAVGPGPSVAGAADVALEVRRQLRGEAWVTLSGRVTQDAGDPSELGRAVRAQIVVSEGRKTDAPSTRTPWTHVIPGADGTFTVRVPAGKTYTLEVQAFGHVVTEAEIEVGAADVVAADLAVPPVGAVTIDATIDGVADDLLVFVHPATEAQADDQLARFLGNFAECAPLLGHPHGDAPACDRVLVRGTTTVAVPPGSYDLAVVRGPFSTLDVQRVDVEAGEVATASLAIVTLPLQPAGTLSADLHVHGAASFDSGIPDVDRVRAFVAAGVDLIASTEHDVVHDFGPALATAGLTGRVRVIQGTESTGHILFPLFDGTPYPKVIGHWNFWPLAYDPAGPWRGAPWDEKAEPAVLFDRMTAQGFDRTTGLIQLNHPYGGFQFGRDFAWPDAIDMDLNRPLAPAYDGTGHSMFQRTPPGATSSNAAYDVQEVMNGSANGVFVDYRAFWHYLLNQGVVRAGTANSDSHTLTENVIGFPRTLVRAAPDASVAEINAALRGGEAFGTNGPILDVRVVDDGRADVTPSVVPFAPDADAALAVTVRAAPWVPVDEVRVLVNGEVKATFRDLPVPDPFGTTGLDRLDVTVPLADLLPATGDAWIVVEAGRALVPNADLDCDGWPDTGDHNGDGVIDARDVLEPTEADDRGCLDTVGPLLEPPPARRGEPGAWFPVVVPGGHPMSFTNPLLIDRDGHGFQGAGR